MILDYQRLREVMEDLRSQTITAVVSGMPHGGGAGRTVEQIALRTLPQDDQKAYDAVTGAIAVTEAKPGGKERIAMIRYLYWGRNRHKLTDAAMHCNISVQTAKRWHGDFVRMVGLCYGFTLKDDTTEPK